MKRPSRALALVAIGAGALTGLATSAHPQTARNPLGITIVRFAKGTTPAQMRSSVEQAGGKVVVDLSRIGALAVLPASSSFGGRVEADPRVKGAFQDGLITDVVGPDGTRARRVAPANGQGGGGAQDDNLSEDVGRVTTPPDPLHEASSFWGVTSPEGILQWDDRRMNVPAAWARTTGDRSVRVAVLDSGVQFSHKDLRANVDRDASANMIPCEQLRRELGAETLKSVGLWDCSDRDTDGHGTWVASRIAGAANGFASNGVAPNVQIVSYKVLATDFGGLASWIVAGMLDACSHHVDVVNMSIAGYFNPDDPLDAADYLLFVDAVDYCRAQGTIVVSAAGNEHVRINRVNMTVGGRPLVGVGQVSDGPEGIATTFPGSTSLDVSDVRGLLEAPAGLPGVVMVSATNDAIGQAPASVPLRWAAHVGARDQLTYYSSYGSRVDLAAPGGARRFNIASYDGGPDDILYGGWGSLGALASSGETCTDPALSSPLNFACFRLDGAGFGWLQGTSMAAPNAAGVAALALSARPDLRGHPDRLLARLQATARRDMVNYMGPNDPRNLAPAFDGRPCSTGYCHLDQAHRIRFAEAYGAGIVNAAAAVAP